MAASGQGDERVPAPVQGLASQVEADGGRALAVYREPIGGHWQIFTLLPIDKVSPTPYQRDLSPTHAKRLQEMVKRVDRFVDPIVVVSPRAGVYWTPNGHHRLRALQKLKAHNLKEKSLEVIRMYRGLLEEEPKKGEEDYAFQFEAAHHITLGLLYEQNKRFAGGAFAPILRRVDSFLSGTFVKTMPVREERAKMVRAVDEALAGVVDQLKKRGIRHPFVKNYVLARTTPLSRARTTQPGFDQTLEKLLANIESFDVSAVRYQDVQRGAMMAIPAAE